MPSDSGKWLEFSEEELLMRKCSYWMKIDGEDTTNTSTQRVFIPVPPQRRPKQIDSNPLKSKKKSRLILNAILTSIFYSISENFNSIFLGGFEVEQVYSSST
jgi:hypothetical protein